MNSDIETLLGFVKDNFEPRQNLKAYCCICGKLLLARNLEKHMAKHKYERVWQMPFGWLLKRLK